MKNSKDFIIDEIINLTVILKGVLCKYGFDDLSHTHFVEVSPREKFNDPLVKEALAVMMFSFYDAYPRESIVFVSKGDHLQPRSPLMLNVSSKDLISANHQSTN